MRIIISLWKTKIGAAIMLMGLLMLASGFQTGTWAADLNKAKKFYEGKTFNFVVPFSPGGGFDTYARGISPFLEKYIPGLTVVVRNMPGGGGAIATTKVFTAKPDGRTILIIDGIGTAFAQILQDQKVRYDLSKFSWIDRVSAEPPVIATGVHTPYKSLDDLLKAKKPVTFAQRGVSDADYIAAGVACNLLGVPYRNIAGFKGSGESILAVQRKEVDAVELSISTLTPLFKAKELIPILQLARERDPRLPNTPTVIEAAPQKYRDVLSALVNVLALDRSICAPPGVPEDRLQLLRDAFAKTFADPKFKAWSHKVKRPINPMGGVELTSAVQQSLGLRGTLKPLFEEVMKKGRE
jgi:tripartite-type tricarboxylate transporter receptor subunit TctC